MSSMSSIPANRLRPSSKEIPQAAADSSAAAFFLRLRYAQTAKKRNIPFEAGASPPRAPRCSEIFHGSGRLLEVTADHRRPFGLRHAQEKANDPIEAGIFIPSSRRCRPAHAPCSAGWHRFSGYRAGYCGRAPPRAGRARSAPARVCARRVYLLSSCVPPCQASPKTARISP